MRSPVSFCSPVVAAAAAHALNRPLSARAGYLHLEDRGAGGPIPTRRCARLPVAASPAAAMVVVLVAAVMVWAAAAAAAAATAASMVASTAAAAAMPVLVPVPVFPSSHHPQAQFISPQPPKLPSQPSLAGHLPS